MSVEVVMPQMGESITEGTISKWLKQVGDTIERDEPLLEISTDKVDAEVPSPGGGVLLEVRFEEGETVEVDTVLAVLGAEGEKPAASNGTSKAEPAQKEEPQVEVSAPIAKEEPSQAVDTPVAAPAGNATEVVMPQMGESITEGTISKWIKQVGDKIERDEPLLEISTDKVDAEVPSPVEGTLLEIKAQEGDTVEVDSVVALIGAEGSAPAAVPSPVPEVQSQKSAPVESETTKPESSPVIAAPASTSSNGNDKAIGEQTVKQLRKTRSSPLVRNIAKQHSVNISQIQGTGLSGRVTKKDILSFIDSGAALKPEDLLTNVPVARKEAAPQMPATTQPAPKADYVAPQISAQTGDKTEQMSLMRKKIAEHMTFSKQTSAHVTSVYEFDMTNVAKFRNKNKAEFQSRYGTKLTYMPFIFQAVTNALRKFPVVNAQVAGEQIIYKGDINLGMAVALDWGLIVPVIKQADSLSLAGLARAANDLADRARSKKLMPDEVSGGTFTITNPGVFGGLFGTPIINQPQVAILCVGKIEKRPKVITTPEGDDYFGIRQMAYFALTYDHRIVDGADAEQFLSYMKEYLETNKFSI